MRDHGVGVVLPSFTGIADAVDRLSGQWDRYRAATLAVRNRAAFELPESWNGFWRVARRHLIANQREWKA
ncbi:MAG: hypothetical protein H0T52_13960 [Lautropia sp.]|nr:hypothetical protein [Lautropia sp.]